MQNKETSSATRPCYVVHSVIEDGARWYYDSFLSASAQLHELLPWITDTMDADERSGRRQIAKVAKELQERGLACIDEGNRTIRRVSITRLPPEDAEVLKRYLRMWCP